MSSYKETLKIGVIYYFKIGTRLLHREDGPAVGWLYGEKKYYIDGQLHRLDGPAIENPFNGFKRWFYKGKQIDCEDQETFERLLKLKAFW